LSLSRFLRLKSTLSINCGHIRCTPAPWALYLGEEDNVAKEDRGFASMDRAKQREIASKGGKAAHQKGTAHEWTSEEARDAGRKGGIASHRRRREQQAGGPSEGEGDRAVAMDRSSSERSSGWDSSSPASYGSERGVSDDSSMRGREEE
jgi:general stress protein YciG